MSAVQAEVPVRVHLPRLLAGMHAGRPVSLREHLARYGPLGDVAGLIDAVEASGLRGRGGGAFPTGAKLRAVAAERGRPVVVVNGAEGEPVSGKDKVLLRHLPHLVIDGAIAAAAAIGARDVIVTVSVGARTEAKALAEAIAARKEPVAIELVRVPAGSVAGEETAIVQFPNGGPAKPTVKPPWPYQRGVGGAPTLVQNAETLAHLAQIARFGAGWFREAGTADEPGSVLLTISGAVRKPGVHEVEVGTPFVEVIERAGGATEGLRAFLVGGYFGTWLSADEAASLRVSDTELRRVGAGLGAGAIVALPASACGVTETSRVARYLARESAGQCGPCVHGLAAVSGALDRLARLERKDDRRQLAAWLEQVRGRGACRHPDGAARFVESGLRVFADEVEHHLRHRSCSRSGVPVLPVPGDARP